MTDVAHTRFFYAHSRENFGVFDRLFTDIRDNLFTRVERHLLDDLLRFFRRGDSVASAGVLRGIAAF